MVNLELEKRILSCVADFAETNKLTYKIEQGPITSTDTKPLVITMESQNLENPQKVFTQFIGIRNGRIYQSARFYVAPEKDHVEKYRAFINYLKKLGIELN